jgi:glycosyltransferase involved in cell wall biosynthesis
VTVGPHRVAHVITRLELGGAQQNTLYCARNHDRRRFDVTLVAGAGGVLDDDARTIPDAEIHIVPWLRHPISPLQDAIAVRRLRDLFRRTGVDLVHTHSSKAGILGRIAARLARVPAIVHTVHGWSFNDVQPAWQRALYVRLERMAARWSDRLVTVSSRDREKGLAARIGTRNRYDVIHSGIEVDAFRRPGRPRDEMRRELGFGPDDVVVGSVANMKPQKAPLDFVRTAAAARTRDPRLRFLFAGDGPLRNQVERLVDELGVGDVVCLLGWRRDVADLFHAMDVFLLNSLFEGLPRSVLQAMAAGVPVVATSVDGTVEVVDDGRTGLLVPPGDPQAAADAVARMAGDDELRQGCVVEARGVLGGSFDVRVMLDELERLYCSLLPS